MNNLFNLLNAELNSICHLLALLGAHHILHVSRIRVNTFLQFRLSICIYSLFYILPYSQYVVHNVANYSLQNSLFLFYLDL